MSYASSRATATPVSMSKQDYQSVEDQQKLWRILERLQVLITYCTLWLLTLIFMTVTIALVFKVADPDYPLCRKNSWNNWLSDHDAKIGIDFQT